MDGCASAALVPGAGSVQALGETRRFLRQTLRGSVPHASPTVHPTVVPPACLLGENIRKPLILSQTVNTHLDTLLFLELQNSIQENIGPVKDLKVL